MKKLTALFLALALCLSLCTVTAFAETHNLTVTKADGSAATLSNKSDGSDGADYYWQTSGGDTWLTIFNAGLTVSGTTESERILVKASATDLTINGLKISHISTSGTSPLMFAGTATLTLVGDNELTCKGSVALSFDKGGTIAGAGNLTASSDSNAGIFAMNKLTFTQTGTVTASGAYGIGGRDDVSFKNGIGKILARGSNFACVSNGGEVKRGDALTMKGSTAFNTAEASITGVATIDGGYVKTGDQFALSVLIEGAKYTVTFDANGHGTAPAAITDVASGTTINKPTDLTAAGYTFGGWYKETGCTNAWNFATDKVTADTTLYAKWTATGGGNHHHSSTTTPTVTSATTADMGVAIYGVLTVSSLLGMGWVSKKKR